jgi:hypothetical protein
MITYGDYGVCEDAAPYNNPENRWLPVQILVHGAHLYANLFIRPIADRVAQALELIILLAQFCLLLCVACMMQSPEYPRHLEMGLLGVPLLSILWDHSCV